MNLKKIAFLFLALLVPSLLFVFLKNFGRNQFDVEVLFTEGMPGFTDSCQFTYDLPYQLPDTVLADLNADKDSAVFAYFGDRNAAFISRVSERYREDPVGYKVFDNDNSVLKKCIFVLEEPFDIALVDNRGRIRGQYNSSDREEVDRLITELAILIRKY